MPFKTSLVGKILGACRPKPPQLYHLSQIVVRVRPCSFASNFGNDEQGRLLSRKSYALSELRITDKRKSYFSRLF